MAAPATVSPATGNQAASNDRWWPLLGVCPLLAAADATTTGLTLGAASLLAAGAAVTLAWSLRGRVAVARHMLSALLVIAALVSLLGLVAQAFFYRGWLAVGASLPLIMTNGSIIGQAEDLAAGRHGSRRLRADLLLALGFALLPGLLGLVREFAGEALGRLAGFHLMATPAGAFLGLAALTAVLNVADRRRRRSPHDS